MELFQKFVNNDPTKQLVSFFKEENQRAQEHELKLMELFMSPMSNERVNVCVWNVGV